MQDAWRTIGGVLVVLLCLTVGLVSSRAAVAHSGAQGAKRGDHAQSRPFTPMPALRLAMPDASPTIDPALVADESNVQLANLLYVGLVRLDDHYNVVPSAAERYSVSANHL